MVQGINHLMDVDESSDDDAVQAYFGSTGKDDSSDSDTEEYSADTEKEVQFSKALGFDDLQAESADSGTDF